MITCKFCHKLTAQDWGEPCPYCRIKALVAQLADAELFVSYCAGLDMPEKIRTKAQAYIDKDKTDRR